MGHRPSPDIPMWVHALEGEASAAPEKTWWVRKDGRGRAKRVLFLGSPNSFAMDASLLGGDGSSVYFVYPNGWDGEKCIWLIPQPIVAPVQVNTCKTSQIYFLHNTIFGSFIIT